MSEDPTYLPEASIDQLVDELARRGQAVVVGLAREDQDGSEGVVVFYRGGEVRACGIIEIIRARLRQEFVADDVEEL